MTEQTAEAEKTSNELELDVVNGADENLLTEMMQAGIHYGRKKSKTNPKMKPYIFMTRNDIELIDLNFTLTALDKAIEFLKSVKKNGGIILAVATQAAAQNSIKNFIEKFNCPYVIHRWLGGTLTNFKVIRGRLEYFQHLKEDKETGQLDKYTKKERLKISQNLDKMNLVFGGLTNLTSLPSALVTININLHSTAVREAKRLKIPVVAVINTDANPLEIDYPIPANDNAKSSIDWIFNKIIDELGMAAVNAPIDIQSANEKNT